MNNILHITSGDRAGDVLAGSGLPGDLLVWHDILYDGPRQAGWPGDEVLAARAVFLEQVTGGGLTRKYVLRVLTDQYQKLATLEASTPIVLWFDACLFDQSMLAHLLVVLRHLGLRHVELLCVDAFPGIEPFDGLGQLEPSQLASLYDRREVVTEELFAFAELVDRAFACQDILQLTDLARRTAAPLPWIAAAAARWLAEQPDPVTGLGRLEQLALSAVRSGCGTPKEIYANVAANDTHPQYWGDITLWAKLNGLAERTPPLLRIEGPAERLPQWESTLDLQLFHIEILPAT